MNILLLRHSAGFEHSYLPNAEVTFKHLAQENGWRVTTTHLLGNIKEDVLKSLDVLVFATTGNLALDAAQKKLVIDFVRNGKGFMGIHNGADTGYDWPEYGEMVGGYFTGHPWTQEVTVKVEDPNHPAVRHLGRSFRVFEEVYTFKNWDRKKTHVIMSLDNSSVDISKGNRPDNDYAMAWCHSFGKGRVMYTALGHPDDLWSKTWFQTHIVGGLKYAAGLEG